MEKTKIKKQNNGILLFIKLCSIMLCGIIFCSWRYRVISHELNGKEHLFSMKIMLIYLIVVFVAALVIGGIIWKIDMRYRKIEYFIYFFIFTAVIFVNDSYQSDYKFLFLILIVMATIQLGIRFGVLITIMASLIVILMDIVNLPQRHLSVYFENDLITISVFLLVIIILKYYLEQEDKFDNITNEVFKDLNQQYTDNKLKRNIELSILKNRVCFNLLFDNSREAILVYSEGEIIYINSTAAKMFGVDNLSDISKKGLKDYLPDEKQRCELEIKLKKLIEEKTDLITCENKILLGDKVKIVRNVSTHFEYDGKNTIFTILEDITPEKKVEKLESDVKKNVQLLIESRNFNQVITEFFSNISHELKTPLNVIYTALQVLKITNGIDEKQIAKREKYEDIIRQNCYRLMRLINNLLDITKFDSGFLKLNLKNYDIVEMIENIVLSVVPYAESRGIDLIFDTEIEERSAAVDADMLERVILNLLSNAIKFTGNGGRILVNLYNFIDHVSISVKDNGEGIPKEKIKSIFNRFEQVDKSLTKNREGTGIGLSLVKSFVGLHKGTIDVKSEVGKGSEFIITIPIQTVELTTNETEHHGSEKSCIERINIEFADIYANQNE